MGICVARQPIFTKGLKVYGYELFFRNNDVATSVGEIHRDTASSETILSSIQDLGVEKVTNGKRAFINFTEKLILDQIATLLPNSILVIEVTEPIAPTPEILANCRKLKEKGYLFAFDDFVVMPGYGDFLPLADIIRIDFTKAPLDMVRRYMTVAAGKDITLLAKMLETNDDFAMAKSMGFTIFQGKFFCRPVNIETKGRIATLKGNCLRLVGLSFDSNIDVPEIAEIIKQDVALSYMLFRVVNSAFFGLNYTVNNIKQALTILGLEEIKKWVTLISMSRMTDDKPSELVSMSLTRARFMELLAPLVGEIPEKDNMFMMGLLSLMDSLMDMTLQELVNKTGISEEISVPLLTREGKFGELLSMIISYENSEWDAAQAIAERYGLSMDKVSTCYTSAITWAGII